MTMRELLADVTLAAAVAATVMCYLLARRVDELERWQQETRPCWVLRGIPGEAATVDTPSLPPLRARASRSTADGAGTSNENDESHEKRVR